MLISCYSFHILGAVGSLFEQVITHLLPLDIAHIMTVYLCMWVVSGAIYSNSVEQQSDTK